MVYSHDCKIKERNILVVNIRADNKVFVEGREMPIEQIYFFAKMFLMNPFNDEVLPEFKCDELPLIGMVNISKQLISLYASRDCDYKSFIAVNDVLERAYNDSRNEYANLYFNSNFDRLNIKQAKVIRQLCPKRISEAEPNFIRRDGELVANDWWDYCW